MVSSTPGVASPPGAAEKPACGSDIESNVGGLEKTNFLEEEEAVDHMWECATHSYHTRAQMLVLSSSAHSEDGFAASYGALLWHASHSATSLFVVVLQVTSLYMVKLMLAVMMVYVAQGAPDADRLVPGDLPYPTNWIGLIKSWGDLNGAVFYSVPRGTVVPLVRAFRVS